MRPVSEPALGEGRGQAPVLGRSPDTGLTEVGHIGAWSQEWLRREGRGEEGAGGVLAASRRVGKGALRGAGASAEGLRGAVHVSRLELGTGRCRGPDACSCSCLQVSAKPRGALTRLT